jgi:hypothetical protein
MREDVLDDGHIERHGRERQRAPRRSDRLNQRALSRRDLRGARDQRVGRVHSARAPSESCLHGQLRDADRIAAAEHEQTIPQFDSRHRHGE